MPVKLICIKESEKLTLYKIYDGYWAENNKVYWVKCDYNYTESYIKEYFITMQEYTKQLIEDILKND